jgi:hypothetical protein
MMRRLQRARRLAASPAPTDDDLAYVRRTVIGGGAIFAGGGAFAILSGRPFGVAVGVVSLAFGLLILASVWIGTRERRILPIAIRAILADVPQRRPGQHRVTVTLKDGRIVKHVWIAYGTCVVAVGRLPRVPFSASDVVQVKSEGDASAHSGLEATPLTARQVPFLAGCKVRKPGRGVCNSTGIDDDRLIPSDNDVGDGRHGQAQAGSEDGIWCDPPLG